MTTFYTPSGDPNVFGGFPNKFSSGYNAESLAKVGTADKFAASGYLYSHSLNQRVNLWISEVTADFSLAGGKGQSRFRREFFPHGFNDVKLQISGQTPSTYEYNRLAAFVRESQYRALAHLSTGLASEQTFEFGLFDNTPSAWHLPPITQNSIGRRSNVKGGHRDWRVQGYIPYMKAGAVALEVAPTFVIQFVVVESGLASDQPNTNLWSETLAPVETLRTFLELVDLTKNEAGGAQYIPAPNVKTLPPATVATNITKALSAVSSVWSTSVPVGGAGNRG